MVSGVLIKSLSTDEIKLDLFLLYRKPVLLRKMTFYLSDGIISFHFVGQYFLEKSYLFIIVNYVSRNVFLISILGCIYLYFQRF